MTLALATAALLLAGPTPQPEPDPVAARLFPPDAVMRAQEAIGIDDSQRVFDHLASVCGLKIGLGRPRVIQKV